MIVCTQISEVREALSTIKSANQRVGFVPTMGALHEGHDALVRASKDEADFTVCSIFINPRQFNNPDDLKNYPVDRENDLSRLDKLGCNMAFLPETKEIYPHENNALSLDFGHLDTLLEGSFRPGHFAGVGLVVAKLLNIVQPDSAFFGQKDLQQFYVIKTLVEDLNFHVNLIRVPTVRDEYGLALSSRNRLLSSTGITTARAIYKALMQASSRLHRGEELAIITNNSREFLKNARVEVEYFEAVDVEKFEIIENFANQNEVAFCTAGKVEGIRLIDNVIWKYAD